MNADSVFEILQEANPVPDPVRYRQMTTAGLAFLATTKERTLHMETITQGPEKQGPPTRRRGLAIAAAVFVVVLLGVALALRPTSEVISPAPPTTVTTIPEAPTTVATTPGPPFSTPAEAAEAYLNVRYTGNYGQLESLMATEGRDQSLTFEFPRDTALMRLRFDWIQALRGPITDLECVELTSVIASCSFTTEWLDVTRLTGDGTITMNQKFTLDTEGRLLAVGEETSTFAEEWRAAVRAFGGWVNERHPDLVAEEEAVFGGGGDYVVRPAEEIIADWNAARDEYLAENG
ncbi:MAG: hypothetical protein JJE47_04540 [Acidimicrobiia bacterium]|nr:hypothetical protein [Acidimicrobiia bacterium]